MADAAVNVAMELKDSIQAAQALDRPETRYIIQYLRSDVAHWQARHDDATTPTH